MTSTKQRRFHMILDAKECDLEVLTSKEDLKDIIQTIADLAGMNIIHGPVVIDGVPQNPGVTGFAIIDFSQISIHTFTNTKEFCLDVFSCKEFDYGKIKKYIMDVFKLRGESQIKYKEINL